MAGEVLIVSANAFSDDFDYAVRVRYGPMSTARSIKFKVPKVSCLLVQAVIAVGLAAQVPPATSDLPTNQQVIGFLTQSIDWYRHCAVERQIATNPADFIFVEDNRPRAAHIVQLAFDFARADAQFSAMLQANGQKKIATSAGSPELAQFVEFESNTDLQSRHASEQIEAIKTKLKAAHGAQRRQLQVALDAAQSRSDVLQAGLVTLRQLIEFMRSFRGQQTEDLASSIDDLARTVPDVTSPPAPMSQPQSLSLALPSKAGDSGILTLSSEVTGLGRKLRILDDEILRTNNLTRSSDELHKPLLAFLNKRLPVVAENILEAGDLAELQQQKAKLDELASIVKALSPAIVALDKQRVLLGAYTSRLNSWRAAIIAEDKKTWTNLMTRLVGAVLAIGALLIIGAVVRRVTRHHMEDTEGRHIVLVIQRVVLWAAMLAIAAFSFASDLTSLATFFGLVAAGVAVALQSVIVSAVSYFVLVGRRGIRIGDQVQISGISGEVTDISWLQFQLREIDNRTQQPTGNVVTFSNSVVLASPATGLSKFNRQSLKAAQLEVAAKASNE